MSDLGGWGSPPAMARSLTVTLAEVSEAILGEMLGSPITLPLEAPLALVVQLLEWVEARPRTYAETMEAWRTSCPRLPVWEDATGHNLVAVVPGVGGMRERSVCLTAEGRAFLRSHAACHASSHVP